MTNEELIEFIKWAVDDLLAASSRLACETEEGKKVAETFFLAMHNLKNLIAVNDPDV